MQSETDREPLFSAERWRASRDLRTDLACVVAVIAILAGLATLDTDSQDQAPAEALSVTR
jgi:hypothetical protein